MATLSGILGLAIAGGVNIYLAVLTLGAGIRWGWFQSLPGELEILAHPIVLGVAAVFYAADFIADKVPFVTPLWDSVHTVVRPVGVALLAFGAAAKLDPLVQALAVLAAGSVALGTHSTKMGVRLAAHAAPEPVTHSALSVAEDLGVIGLLVLAFTYPWIAIPVLAVLVLLIAISLWWIGRRVWRFLFGGQTAPRG